MAKTTEVVLADRICINGVCRIVEKKGKDPKFFLEIHASTADIDLEDDIISIDAIRGAQHDLLKNNTILLGHDRDVIVGSTVESDFAPPESLKLKMLISNTRPKEQQMIRENALNKASIGGRILNSHEGVDKRTGKKVRIVDRIRFHEVSLVSLPANQEARSLRWWMDKGEKGIPMLKLLIGERAVKGGDKENMAKKEGEGGGDGGKPEGGEPQVTETEFAIDLDGMKSVDEDIEAQARATKTQKKMRFITEQLVDHPDEQVGKAAEALNKLFDELPVLGQKKEPSEKDERLDRIEALLKELKTDPTNKVEKPKGTKTPKVIRPGTPKGAGAEKVEGDGGSEGGEPAEESTDAEIKAELEKCDTYAQKVNVLRKHGRWSVKAAA